MEELKPEEPVRETRRGRASELVSEDEDDKPGLPVGERYPAVTTIKQGVAGLRAGVPYLLIKEDNSKNVPFVGAIRIDKMPVEYHGGEKNWEPVPMSMLQRHCHKIKVKPIPDPLIMELLESRGFPQHVWNHDSVDPPYLPCIQPDGRSDDRGTVALPEGDKTTLPLFCKVPPRKAMREGPIMWFLTLCLVVYWVTSIFVPQMQGVGFYLITAVYILAVSALHIVSVHGRFTVAREKIFYARKEGFGTLLFSVGIATYGCGQMVNHLHSSDYDLAKEDFVRILCIIFAAWMMYIVYCVYKSLERGAIEFVSVTYGDMNLDHIPRNWIPIINSDTIGYHSLAESAVESDVLRLFVGAAHEEGVSNEIFLAWLMANEYVYYILQEVETQDLDALSKIFLATNNTTPQTQSGIAFLKSNRGSRAIADDYAIGLVRAFEQRRSFLGYYHSYTITEFNRSALWGPRVPEKTIAPAVLGPPEV